MANLFKLTRITIDRCVEISSFLLPEAAATEAMRTTTAAMTNFIVAADVALIPQPFLKKLLMLNRGNDEEIIIALSVSLRNKNSINKTDNIVNSSGF